MGIGCRSQQWLEGAVIALYTDVQPVASLLVDNWRILRVVERRRGNNAGQVTDSLATIRMLDGVRWRRTQPQTSLQFGVEHRSAADLHSESAATNQHVHISNVDFCFDDDLFTEACFIQDARTDYIYLFMHTYVIYFLLFLCTRMNSRLLCAVVHLATLASVCRVSPLVSSLSLSGFRLRRRSPCWCPAPGCCSPRRVCCHQAPPCRCTIRSNCSNSSCSSSSSRHK